MNKQVKNTDLTCIVSYYQGNELLASFEADLPKTQDDLYNAISFELDNLIYEGFSYDDRITLVAVVSDLEGNPIYRMTRGHEDGILQVEDLVTGDYYVAYSEESYDFEVINKIYPAA